MNIQAVQDQDAMQTVVRNVLPTLLGFALAQLVNFAALARSWYIKPRLRIKTVGEGHVLLDLPEDLGGREIVYGFEVQNRGRSIARGVRAFLTKIEIRNKDDTEFRQFSTHTCALPWYGSGTDRHPAVLVRNGSLTVHVASWSEALPYVAPASGVEELYDEICAGAAQFRFTVAVVEDGGEQCSQAFTIDNFCVWRAQYL